MIHPTARRLPQAAGAFFLCALLAPSGMAATLCVQNRSTGQFEAYQADPSVRPAQVLQPETDCALPGDGARPLQTLSDVQRAAWGEGTRVVAGGSVVTNQRRTAAASSTPVPAATAPAEPSADWDILASDGTLQRTLSRWGAAAGWQVIWEGVPEIRNPGDVRLPGRTFRNVADYVIEQARLATQVQGFDLKAIAYANNVIVISKESTP